jgi:hypothetical protein
MCKLTKFRLVEIGVALLLTFAALIIFGLRVWAADALHDRAGGFGAGERPGILLTADLIR